MRRVERLVRGSVIPAPLWYEAAKSHPPPLKTASNKPKVLSFPEDELRRVWLQRNPHTASRHPKALFIEDDLLPASAREHPGDVFVERQLEFMRSGKTREEAYAAAGRELEHEERVRALEAETARQQAAALGAAPATEQNTAAAMRPMLRQQLLRRFAEEARDQGLPYPRHWFDAKGKWKGIGADKMREDVGVKANAIDKQSIDGNLIQTVLAGLDLNVETFEERPAPAEQADEHDGYLPEYE